MQVSHEVTLVEAVVYYLDPKHPALGSPFSVIFSGGSGTGRMNDALAKMNKAEQREFMEDFLSLWQTVGCTRGGYDELVALFGDPWTIKVNDTPCCTSGLGTPLMFTLTADERQFRCWFAVPGFIERNNVGDKHDGMLFSVELVELKESAAELMSWFIEGITRGSSPLLLPNGIALWLPIGL